MGAQRLPGKIGLAAAALLLSGCGVGAVFDLYPEGAAADPAAPWPALIDTVRREEAARPALDPATGAALVSAMDVEAALAQADSARVSVPVFDVAPLRAEAAAVRAGRP